MCLERDRETVKYLCQDKQSLSTVTLKPEISQDETVLNITLQHVCFLFSKECETAEVA